MENMPNDIEMGSIPSHFKTTCENESQTDSSFEEQYETMTVEVDVHAEMGATVADQSDAENTDAMSLSSMEKPVTKKKMMATAEQKASYDEMFSIDSNVPWRTAKENLHRYRIKPEKTFTEVTGRKPVSSWSNTKPAKILLSQRNRSSLIERPSSSETPKRKLCKSSFIQADQSIADELDATINRGRKRKLSDSQEKALITSSDSDEDQENTCMQASPSSSSLDLERSPKTLYSKNRHVLSPKSPQSQVSESSSSLFDLISAGPKFHMGNEIDSSKSPTTLVTYGKGYSLKQSYDSDSSDDN